MSRQFLLPGVICTLLFFTAASGAPATVSANTLLAAGKLQEKKIDISGKVTDQAGNPLPGVTIIEKGTQNGTVSNEEGNYRISVDENAVLVFSALGMDRQEVPLNGRDHINVIMNSSEVRLNEVVAIGYGTQKKKDLTGAIASVGIEEIQHQPASNIETLLQGKASGVYIRQSSGAPGGNLSVSIRGQSSINAGTEPLYVIDGVPIYNSNKDPGGTSYGTYSGTNALASLNPGDIASIQILKDASATAIYGSRGSNGVVIITTKRGSGGHVSVNYDGYYGVQQVANTLSLMDGEQQAEFFNDWAASRSLPPPFANPQEIGKGTDWQKEIFRTSSIQNHEVSVSNSNEQAKYYVSANYFDQDGIIINSNLKRYSVRANVDENLSKKLHFSQSFTFSRTINKAVPLANGGDGNVRSAGARAYVTSPTIPVFDDDGNYVTTWYGANKPDNPVAALKSIDSRLTEDNLLGNMSLDYTIIKGLTAKTLFGVNLINNSLEEYYPKATTYIGGILGGLGNLANRRITDVLNENTITYSHDFHEDHHLEVLGGFTWQTDKDISNATMLSNFSDDRLGVNAPGSSTGVPIVTSSINEWSLASWLGRVNYQYKNKYLLTATFRADGSSKFGVGNKWGYFPSVAAGWRLSDEAFMQDVTFINDLKIRGSYGLTGNDQIGNYQSLPKIDNTVTYIFDNQLISGSRQTSLGNADLKWERSGQWDVGLDATIINNRISLTFDYYQKTTHDLLFTINLPANSGYSTGLYNTGGLSNKGIEFGLNADILTGGFKWNLNANYSSNKTRMTSLGQSGSTSLFIGYPPGAYLGYVYEGVFHTQKEIDDQTVQKGVVPGDAKYKDTDNSGTINANDRIVMGSPLPKYTFGVNNTFSYRDFTLSIFLQGVQGITGSKIAGIFDPSDLTTNKSIDLVNRWTPDNPNSNIPRAGYANKLSPSTYDITDLSYVKIRNIRLNYHFPQRVLPKIGSLNVYLSGENLVTFTKYVGFDPDGGNDYPPARTIMFGVNVGF